MKYTLLSFSAVLQSLQSRPKALKAVVIICIVFTSPVVAVAMLLGGTQHIELDFQSQTCTPALTAFPREISDRSGYTITYKDTLTLAGFSLAAKTICVSPKDVLRPGLAVVQVPAPALAKAFLSQQVIIRTPALPQASLHQGAKKLPLSKKLAVSLSVPDSLHAYSIQAESKSAACESADRTLACSIDALGLGQGKDYEVSIWRAFKNTKSTQVASGKIAVLESTALVDSSIQNDELVYSRPDSIELIFSKSIKKHSLRLIATTDGGEVSIDSKTQLLDSKKLLVTFDPASLPRKASVALKVISLEAEDGSTLDSSTIIQFKTSGGPRVTSTNISSHDVASGAQLIVQFDQAVQPSVAKLLRVEGINASVRIVGDKAIISLDPSAAKCTGFRIVAPKGISSVHAVQSESEWSIQTRLRCYEVRTIGYSVKGKPITAFFFGSGANTVLYTGAIHGSEISSKYTMDAWVNELSARATEIPVDKQIIIIPSLNPDGVASRSRYNANNINLNRNFPTANWTADTPLSGGRIEQGAGGPYALSEPESQALARFTQQLRPQLVVTYHSIGSLVNSNDIGQSIAVGREYARLAGYRFIANSQTNATFDLEMTGTYEDWLLEIGIPAILIELPTHSSNHLNRDRNALWYALRS